MKKYKIITFLLCLISVVAIFTFFGCSNTANPSGVTDSDITGGADDNGNSNDNDGDVKQDNILIAYFSLAENLDNEGNILSTGASMTSVGDVTRLASYIQSYTGGEIFSIRTVKKYPNSFQGVVDENHSETENPALQSKVADMGKYDTVFIGYPVWATTIPRAIRTFIAENDLSGKTVIPFCSHDGYGAGSSFSTISSLSGASTLKGFVIRGSQTAGAQNEVNSWLEEIGIRRPEQSTETYIEMIVGDITLKGVLNDTALQKSLLLYCRRR